MTKQRYPSGHAKFHQNGWVDVPRVSKVQTSRSLNFIFWAVVVLTALVEIIARGGV